VTYEKLVADPTQTVKGILDLLDVQVHPGWRLSSLHVRQADQVNADWVRRYRRWAHREPVLPESLRTTSEDDVEESAGCSTYVQTATPTNEKD
jgi:hypothetical protein